MKNNIECDYNVSSFPILVNDRDLLKKKLEKNKIQTQIIYNKCIPEQVFFKKFKVKNVNFKNAKIISKKTICLPCHSYLGEKDIKKIIDVVNKHYEK